MQIWTASKTKSLLLFLTLVPLFSLSCAKSEKRPTAARADEIENEVSLKEDRRAIEALRKDIPPDKKTENDRLAEMLKRWQEVKMSPDELRDRFDNELRKSRTKFEKQISRKREAFNSEIKEEREKFRDKQKEERDDFNGHKVSEEKRRAFYDRQDDERRKFEEDLKDKRDDFEDNLKEERKDYDDIVTNLRSEFHSEFPEYQRKYKEFQAQKEKDHAARGLAPSQPRHIPSVAAQLMNMDDTEEENATATANSAPGNAGGGSSGGRPAASPKSGEPTSDLSEFDEIPGRGKRSGH